jgi:hypothetical protein
MFPTLSMRFESSQIKRSFSAGLPKASPLQFPLIATLNDPPPCAAQQDRSTEVFDQPLLLSLHSLLPSKTLEPALFQMERNESGNG